ncbi:hypothetical protein DRO32_00235 [Candidatus Bathyarchaeota archaeon]|nr:MAG: hypothetical protein DRO32_00235 [Candidatus Bathyarchaeota archaeon]
MTMGYDVSLEDLRSLLRAYVDDLSVIKAEDVSPHLPEGRRPEDLMPGVRSVIVHLTALKHTIGRYRPGGWWNNRYPHVRAVNEVIGGFLRSMGFEAVCPSPQGHDRRTLMPKLQFKPIALRAGLGWRGKNNLLIHPEFGPRVVLGVVLTDAAVEEAGRPILEDGCGECDLCLHVCPIGALRPDGSFDRFRCYRRNKWLKRPCGFPCMRVCPVGMDYDC